MNKLFKGIVGVIAFALVSLCASAQTPATETPDLPEIGNVTGTTYANKYFGLTLSIPTGWQVQDASVKKQISEKGKELVTSDDPAKKGELDRAAESTLNLLTVSQLPVGEPGFNPTFLCGTEKIPGGVATDVGYMSVLKNTIKYSQVPITVERDVYVEQIGGVAFSAIDLKVNYSGVIVSQNYYAHIMKNYTLFFIVTYQTDEQLKTQTEILRTVVFR